MVRRVAMMAVVMTLVAGSDVLCAGPAKPDAAPPAPPSAAPPGPYAAGDLVEAQHGHEWLRGTVAGVRPGKGGAVEFDVVLANGERTVLPARMLRKPR
jgi:hypothetical protein